MKTKPKKNPRWHKWTHIDRVSQVEVCPGSCACAAEMMENVEIFRTENKGYRAQCRGRGTIFLKIGTTFTFCR